MPLFFASALAVLIVAAVVNAVSRRPVLNGGRIGGVLVLGLMVMNIGLLLFKPDPSLGRRVGSVVGQAFLPLLLCAWMDRRHAARLRQRGQPAGAEKHTP